MKCDGVAPDGLLTHLCRISDPDVFGALQRLSCGGLVMLPDGRYSAYFQANDQDGMGVIELNAGRLTGGDTIISYFGTYFQAGDQFTASIRTERHSPGHAALFGNDNVDISINGTSKDSTGAGTGHVKQLPGAVFKVVLVRMAD